MAALTDLKEAVVRRYEALTGAKPSKICTAPGRVNLIGEHIDYNGFGVVPCAVGRFTVIAIGISKSSETRALSLASINADTKELNLSFEAIDDVPRDKHHWSNYVLASYVGLRESGVVLPKNIQMVVGGNLPQACGLSSSSSLVVASALAMSSIRLTRQYISREMLADMCMKSEWHVGTAGGGMDQAAILLSKCGYATSIQFNPLRTRLIQLPSGISIILANSLALSAKAETAHSRFNKRVFECRIGLRVLRQILTPLNLPDPVQDTFASLVGDVGGIPVLIERCREIVPKGLVSKFEIIKSIGADVLEDMLARGRWGRQVWDMNEDFILLNRALHVLSEAKRVDDFCAASEIESSDYDSLYELINDSGRSCDVDYDCSCDELRNLIHDMMSAGCRAARLTGAGWGGCAVGIVESKNVSTVIDRIWKLYFIDRLGRGIQIDDQLVFSFEPANGAIIEDV
jgi:N-acetylgalactosamine kinase